MKHVVMFSAGGGSWAAAKRVAAQHGVADLTLLFTDTLMEDVGRLRRPGQTRQVDAIYAHTNGGSDPVIVEMLGLKASQSQDPLAGSSEIAEADDTRIRKLAEAYLAKARGGME